MDSLRDPSNTYNQKKSNKRQLAAKKRYKDTTAKIPHPQNVVDFEFLKATDCQEQSICRVAGIIDRMDGKILSLISIKTDEETEFFLPKTKSITQAIAMGDLVRVEEGEITGILERKNLLSRLKGDNARFSIHSRKVQAIAANLDFVVIAASAKEPKFQPGFIDRYLLLAQKCGISPIICITKSDLAPIDDPVLDWYENTLKIPVVHTSSLSQFGIEKLRSLLEGKTAAFVGKSGVGKSSLANVFLGEELAVASEVSEKGGQGQHTTTRSQIYTWKEHSYIVDTPGIRSLELLELNPDEMMDYFQEFTEHTSGCEYRDCGHIVEPNCGVKTAVASGKITESRYSMYARLLGK